MQAKKIFSLFSFNTFSFFWDFIFFPTQYIVLLDIVLCLRLIQKLCGLSASQMARYYGHFLKYKSSRRHLRPSLRRPPIYVPATKTTKHTMLGTLHKLLNF